MIGGVLVSENPSNHSDTRRDIMVVSNSEQTDVPCGQVKVLVVKETPGAWLGGQAGHYHEYSESYLVATGKATFYLQQVDNGLKQVVELHPGQRLVMPARVAHKVFAAAGTTLIGVTEKPYTGPGQDQAFTVQTMD